MKQKSTSLSSASYISCQRDTARSCCRAQAVQQSIDISYTPGPQQQTRTLLQRSIDGTDGRTDGHRTVTLTQPTDASSVNEQ